MEDKDLQLLDNEELAELLAILQGMDDECQEIQKEGEKNGK